MKDIHRTLLILLCLCSIAASAQSFEEYKRQQQAKFNSYAQKKADEFRAYRDRVNAEYVDYMRKAWTREKAQPAKPLPKRPEPPKPVVREPLQVPRYDLIPLGDVKKPEMPDFKKVDPIIPIDELEGLNKYVASVPTPEVKKPEGLTFKWCGMTWNVPL